MLYFIETSLLTREVNPSPFLPVEYSLLQPGEGFDTHTHTASVCWQAEGGGNTGVEEQGEKKKTRRKGVLKAAEGTS